MSINSPDPAIITKLDITPPPEETVIIFPAGIDNGVDAIPPKPRVPVTVIGPDDVD